MSLDASAFAVRHASPRGFRQAYVRAEPEAGPAPTLVCVHGWPETKRIFWRVIGPLVRAGFDVIVPDLRGFGDSDVAPDGFNDVSAHADDLRALIHGHLGIERVVLAGGDLGGPVVQELALRHPEWVSRMVVFNSPLPYLAAEMDGMRTRPDASSTGYFVRQGTDADALASELADEEARTGYVASFYTERNWACPGSISAEEAAFHAAPFAEGTRLRSSFGNYESVFDAAKRGGTTRLGRNEATPTLVMFGTSDAVIYPDFDLMAAKVFVRHAGPVRIEDCGHFVPWEAPERFVTETVAFCADLLAP